MNAPLDTAFLLTITKNARAWIPLSACNSLGDIVVDGRGRVVYVPDGNIGDFCLPSERRLGHHNLDLLTIWREHEDVSFVNIDVFPVFKHASYGTIENDLRGKWATILNDRGVRDVRALLPMPLSGKSMKRRLLDHRFQLWEEKRHCENSTNWQGLIPFYKGLLEELEKVSDQMPDDRPDHIYCIASAYARNELRDTVVADASKPPQVKHGGAANLLKACGAGNNFPLESLQVRRRPLRLQQSSGLRIAGELKETGSQVQFRDDLQSDI